MGLYILAVFYEISQGEGLAVPLNFYFKIYNVIQFSFNNF